MHTPKLSPNHILFPLLLLFFFLFFFLIMILRILYSVWYLPVVAGLRCIQWLLSETAVPLEILPFLYTLCFSEFCPSGYEVVSGQCVRCPVATYKDNTVDPLTQCLPCPAGYVTASDTATSLSDCSIRTCFLFCHFLCFWSCVILWLEKKKACFNPVLIQF